jgi:6-phosphogluconolactonase (cycloisomerase 2 family)
MRRREFLATLSVMPTLAQAQPSQNPSQKNALLYVGTYSSPAGPEGSKGNGEGIYLFEMDGNSGALTQRQVFKNDSNPSWLALDKSGTHLYSANEISNYKGTNSGSVSAYSVDRGTGQLKLLNTVSSEGAGPAHLSIHPSGKFVLVANYFGGTVAVLAVGEFGQLAAATDVKHNQGKVGPVNATSGPPGSFAISGHDTPHAHMIHADPSGKFVLAADLGLDQILIWKFDDQKGKLIPNTPPFVSVPPGDGPRHFAFHPNGKWLYSLQEEASTMIVFDYDADNGTLTAKQTLSTLPAGFAGTDFTSEVAVSADGRFVYAANRLHDSIAWFSVGPSGTLTLAGEEWTRGDYPRSFTIDPTGSFLFSCNQRGDAIAAFRVDKTTGALTFTGQYTHVGTPAYVLFL